METPVLELENFTLTYRGGNNAVRGVSFALGAGECLALVGESGCGKTSIARAVTGLGPDGLSTTGKILFKGEDLSRASERRWRQLRGLDIGYVAQDPFAACDPLSTIRDHLAESWLAHRMTPDEAEIVRRLDAFGIPEPQSRMRQYPHQWSGGMLQRACIAAATAHNPPLIVADEPTSALDADRADSILRDLKRTGAAILLISHDLHLVASHADRIAVCYAGRIVEIGPAKEIVTRPRHPYTIALRQALAHTPGVLPSVLPGSPPRLDKPIEGCAFAPRCPRATAECMQKTPALLEGVACFHPGTEEEDARPRPPRREAYAKREHPVIAAHGVGRAYGAFTACAPTDVTLEGGEIVGIAGPSGSGKSTLLRVLGTIEPASMGELRFGFPTHPGKRLRGGTVQKAGPGVVMALFQDPTGSLDPRWPIWRSVTEALSGAGHTPRSERIAAARTALASVGLGHLDPLARPGELSVGERQRVAIARAVIAKPRLLVADEPTSALDTAATANVLHLLDGLAQSGTAILIVSHDRPLLSALCDRVFSMEAGRLIGADASSSLSEPREIEGVSRI